MNKFNNRKTKGVVKNTCKQRTSKTYCSCGYVIRGENHEQGLHHKNTKPMPFAPQKGEKYPTNVGDIIDPMKVTKRRG